MVTHFTASGYRALFALPLTDDQGRVGVLVYESSDPDFLEVPHTEMIEILAGQATVCNGVRSYEEIAALFHENTGSSIDAEDVRGFAQSMDASDFWYKKAQERNIAYSEKLTAQRSRRANRKANINIAHISFSARDPDSYFGWLDETVGGFIYNPWSVTILVALLLFQVVIFYVLWDSLGPDILLYYNFGHKSAYDLAQF